VTSPERAAQWGIDTGYVATRPDAWYTPEVREYVAKFRPAAVARDQLPHAVPELSTHDNQQVTLPLNSALQAALAGRKTPKAALAEAQAMRTGCFGHFGRHEAGTLRAWLLILPAVGLLARFGFGDWNWLGSASTVLPAMIIIRCRPDWKCSTRPCRRPTRGSTKSSRRWGPSSRMQGLRWEPFYAR
jgi:hypothetical protein